jgi:hypothetical protein
MFSIHGIVIEWLILLHLIMQILGT